MTLEYENKSPQYIVFKGKVITLTLNPTDKEWYDDQGTIWALATDDYSGANADNRCGVGIFSLPYSSPLNEDCKPHDFAYSSPAYQAFHERSWADAYLKSLLEQTDGEDSITPALFHFLARQEGYLFWENPATND